MKTLNIVARTSTYIRTNTNNSTTVALAGLEEAIRLESQYPSREFLKDTQRADAVFEKLMFRASAGAYQVFRREGALIKTISLSSIGACAVGEKQHKVEVRQVLGRVVVTHTLPNGYSRTDVGYQALVKALGTLADADDQVSLVTTEVESIATAGRITASDIAATKSA